MTWAVSRAKYSIAGERLAMLRQAGQRISPGPRGKPAVERSLQRLTPHSRHASSYRLKRDSSRLPAQSITAFKFAMR